MGLPDIVIEFTKKAIATISVGTGGLVGIIVKDAKSNGSHVLKSVDSIPADLSADNKAYIERAFLGAPKAVHVFVLPAAAEDYTAAYKYFANKRINYICGDPAITPELATNLSTWVKGKRKAGKIHPVAVVPNVVANDKGTVNFCLVGGEKLNVGDTQYTPAQYCSRIAGLLAGLDLNVSATYKPLDEVTAIPEVEDDETVDAAIDAGQLVLYDSGTGIVIGRGVNSLTTVTQEDTEDLKKIKILAIQDLITTDITDTINKSYVGNYSNSYDNKCLLITAIKGYLTQLENKGYIEKNKSVMEINVEKQRAYLESTGVDTTEMDDQAVKEANTGSRVFLKGSLTLYKVNTRMGIKIAQMIKDKKDIRFTVISKLADPDSFGAERVSLTGVSFDDLTLFDWEAQKPGETECPFTFTGYEYLDQIKPQ